MKNARVENEPGTVPEEASQPGRTWGRWPWVNRLVWTERMLTALEKGVKGGRWYSLMDKVEGYRPLWAAFEKVKENRGAAGVDHQTVEMFDARREDELQRLSQELTTGNYRPKAVRRTWIPKPGSREKRPLGIPAVRDRVVQTALRDALEPIFEKDFAERSYGFRPGRGCKDALRRVDELLGQGYGFVVDADLKGYFDSIPHGPLLARVEAKVTDGRVLRTIEAYLKAGIMDELTLHEPEEGTPQGAVISPLLSNIYLDPLDQLMAARGFELVRYADDFVVLCRSAEEAGRALGTVRRWTTDAGLTLHPQKTKIVDTTAGEPFEFLGYRFEKGRRWPRKKSLDKLKDAVRAKTRRTSGDSIERIIHSLNRTLRGWFGYFKHSYKTTFLSLDGWMRMRMRSVLRWRAGRKGQAKGKDQQRWPNAYFAKLGLFSLATAHALACQSRTG